MQLAETWRNFAALIQHHSRPPKLFTQLPNQELFRSGKRRKQPAHNILCFIMVGTTSLSGLISCHLCWSHRHNRKPPVSSPSAIHSHRRVEHPSKHLHPCMDRPPSSLMFRTHSVRTPESGNCSVDYVIRQATRSYCAPPYLLYRHNACLICRIANIAGNTKRSTMWHMRR